MDFLKCWLLLALLWCHRHCPAASAERQSNPPPQYFLSVAAIFRDEDSYLREWIEFHRCAGVEHFFLFNHHSSSQDHEQILEPYIESGVVTLEQAVCDVHCQVPTYTLCMENYGHLTHWLAFIDLDEFLMPSPSDEQNHGQARGEGSSDTSLPATLALFDDYAAVLVHWLIFGSSMHETTPDGLVVEEYTWRAFEASAVIKSIVQPALVAETGGHNHRYQPPFQAVNDEFVVIPFDHVAGEAPSTHEPPSVHRYSVPDIMRADRKCFDHCANEGRLRIHHYRTKSLQHALWRFERDRSFRLNEFDSPDIYPATPEEERAWLQKWDRNDELDTSAHRFLPCMKAALQSAEPDMQTSSRDLRGQEAEL